MLPACGHAVQLPEPAALADPRLSGETTGVLAAVVHEGTTNVIRHGTGGRCVIALTVAVRHVELTIDDDGTPPPREGTVRDSAAGNGLRGLGERAAEAAGSVRAERSTLGGFRLRCVLPLPPGPTAGVGPVRAAAADPARSL